MAEKAKDVKEESNSSKDSTEVKEDVDERGVPLLNRVRELERKLREAEERLAQSEEEEETRGESQNSSNVDLSNLTRQELQRLVEDPRKYVSSILQEHRIKDESFRAQDWLRSQEGYSKDIDGELVKTMRETGLFEAAMDPMQKARLLWKLYKMDKEESVKSKESSDQGRTTKVKSTSPEGSGRVVPLKTGPTKQELIKQLIQAGKDQNFEEEVRINEALEELAYQESKEKS